MIDQALQSKIKKIKINTKRIMQGTLAGDYISAFKGTGLEFNQIREYQMGDDVRSIDWNSSAKINKIMVKQFIEERERTVILAIDISGSTAFSSQAELRKDTIAQLAGTLAFIASQNKDNVGALFFSDKVERWIAPSKGNVHIGKILEALFGEAAQSGTSPSTSLAAALRFLATIKKRNAVVFMISDWIDESSDYQKLLKIVRCKYDFVGMRVLDPCEYQLPDIGFLDVQDPESGTAMTLDTRSGNRAGQSLGHLLQAERVTQKAMFEKYRIDLLDLMIGQSFISPLVKFFHQRIRRSM